MNIKLIFIVNTVKIVNIKLFIILTNEFEYETVFIKTMLFLKSRS